MAICCSGKLPSYIFGTKQPENLHIILRPEMRERLKVALLQREIVWGEPRKNRENFFNAIQECTGADLYILPEMFSTGFCAKSPLFAEPAEDSSLEWMRECALRFKAAIAGSIAINDAGTNYNRFYFVKPDGSFEYYDKHHLFTYGGEKNFFKEGDRRTIVEYKGFRILLQICYDLRFPVFSRNVENYHIAIYVAEWPASRAEVWSALLKARAIENQCYVIGVNRVGDDPGSHYAGHSRIMNAYGRCVAECAPEKEETLCAELTLTDLERFRENFPVLGDRDIFDLK